MQLYIELQGDLWLHKGLTKQIWSGLCCWAWCWHHDEHASNALGTLSVRLSPTAESQRSLSVQQVPAYECRHVQPSSQDAAVLQSVPLRRVQTCTFWGQQRTGRYAWLPASGEPTQFWRDHDCSHREDEHYHLSLRGLTHLSCGMRFMKL